MMQPEKPSLAKTVSALCADIAGLGTGDLAQLRRMDIHGPGVSSYWKLAVKHDLHGKTWMHIFKLFALLTPKGAPGGKKLHDGTVPLGKVLARQDGPRALLSESRLLRFLALPFEKRPEAMEHMCRMIATKGHDGLKCLDVALLLLSPDIMQVKILARDYFSNVPVPTNDTSPDEDKAE